MHRKIWQVVKQRGTCATRKIWHEVLRHGTGAARKLILGAPPALMLVAAVGPGSTSGLAYAATSSRHISRLNTHHTLTIGDGEFDSPASSQRLYKAIKGDTLAIVAREFGTTVREL